MWLKTGEYMSSVSATVSECVYIYFFMERKIRNKDFRGFEVGFIYSLGKDHQIVC